MDQHERAAVWARTRRPAPFAVEGRRVAVAAGPTDLGNGCVSVVLDVEGHAFNNPLVVCNPPLGHGGKRAPAQAMRAVITDAVRGALGVA